MGSFVRVGKGMIVAAGLAAALLTASAGPAAAETTAGYDKGFFIKSENFEVHIGTRTQLQFSATQPDTYMYDTLLGRQEDTDTDYELNVRRFKFFMSGFAYKPTVKWKVQLDVERFKAGGGSSGNVRLEEAFVDLTDKPWTQLRIGQFKIPFGYEKMTSSGKLNLVDRSIVHSFFGVNQEPGVNLYGQSFDKKFRYDVAVTTGVSDNLGFDTKNDLDANGKSDFRYMARVTWEPLTSYVWEEGAVSAPDSPQLTLQLGVMTNRNTVPQDADPFLPKDKVVPFGQSVLGAASSNFSTTTETNLNLWTGVSQSRKSYDRNELEYLGAFKYQWFSVESQAIVGNVDPELRYLQGKNVELRDLDISNEGYRIQPGFMLIPTKLEVVARWAMVDRTSKAKFATLPSVKEETEQTELRAGVNWYFSKHDWKWQFDIGQISTEWKLDGHKLDEPDRADFPGGVGFDDKLIQHNERKDVEFRSQFQFQF